MKNRPPAPVGMTGAIRGNGQAEVRFAGWKGRSGCKETMRTSALIPAFVLALLLLFPTGVRCAQGESGKDATITLERDGCLSKCPVYTLVIHRDGSVQYDGELYVHNKGARSAKISEARARDLFKRFEDGKFLELESSGAIVDAPTMTLSLNVDGRRKVVKDSCVCMPEVESLAKAVDQASGSARWVHGWLWSVIH